MVYGREISNIKLCSQSYNAKGINTEYYGV